MEEVSRATESFLTSGITQKSRLPCEVMSSLTLEGVQAKFCGHHGATAAGGGAPPWKAILWVPVTQAGCVDPDLGVRTWADPWPEKEWVEREGGKLGRTWHSQPVLGPAPVWT